MENGLHGFDALHLACAEVAGVDVQALVKELGWVNAACAVCLTLRAPRRTIRAP